MADGADLNPRADKHPHPGRPKDDALIARRREEILRHAIRHFARSSYANADLDAVAADIGCAKGTLYRYFPSKSELFRSAVDLIMRQLLEATCGGDIPDPVDQIEHVIRSFLAYFDNHPEYVELLIQERAEFRDREKPTYFEYRESARERWRPAFRALMAEGRLREMPVERALDVIGDLLYGTIFVNYFARRRKGLESQAADVIDVLFGGLLTPQELARRARSEEKREIRGPRGEARTQ